MAQPIMYRCVNRHATLSGNPVRECPVCGGQIVHLSDPRFTGPTVTSIALDEEVPAKAMQTLFPSDHAPLPEASRWTFDPLMDEVSASIRWHDRVLIVIVILIVIIAAGLAAGLD